MRQVLWILRKDIGRLWLPAALSLLPLAALATVDRWRSDWQVSVWEGWLNLLVPLTWACLLMLAVREEPPAGERHCWRTWPYRWSALLVAKLLFAALFVHLPVLLADTFVLVTHGFALAEAWPALLAKQALVAAVVTAPALALASVCRQAVQFVFGATLLVGAAAWLAAGTLPVFPWNPSDPLRRTLPAAVAAAGSAWIILRQYRLPRTPSSRAVGAVAAAAAALLLGTISPLMAARLRGSWLSGRAPLAMHLDSGAATVRHTGRGFVEIALPVAATGLPAKAEFLFDPPSATIATSGSTAEPILAALLPRSDRSTELVVRLRRAQFTALQGRNATIMGRTVVRTVRRGATVWLPAGTRGRVPGSGYCTSTTVDGWSLYHEGALKVLCESTTAIAPETEVRLYQPASGQTWVHRLGDSASPSTGPRGDWLSPLRRLQTYFQYASGMSPEMSGGRWLMPSEALPGARVGITPAHVEVWGVMEIRLEGVTLP